MSDDIPCPNCGRLNRPGARYCVACRTPLDVAAPPVAAPLHPGQLLDGGAYRVVRPLGKGGMGAIWLVAQTQAFDRLAVIKEVIDYFDPTDAAERTKAAARFEAEARTLGALKHPGIPDLYAYFSEGGHNYLVMEYIEGPDLRHWLSPNDDRLTETQVLRYAIQICEVLEYLARQQPPVVHNDIKPANIIIDRHSGRAVLVDFGTAQARRRSSPASRPDRQRESIYGTVGYAAPELYRGEAEPRSDVYSLAATAYHLLTDDDPRDHPARFPQLDALPPALVAILQAALNPRLEARLTAAQFRRQLERYLAGLSGPLPAAPPPERKAVTPSQPGKMALRTRRLRLQAVAGQRISARIEIANGGPGDLYGQALSTQPWLQTAEVFACPPGRVCALPIEINTDGLRPGDHLAAVTLTPAGGEAEVVPVQVFVAEPQPPRIEVRPAVVDLGTVDRQALHTAPQKVLVANRGGGTAQVRVEGAPRWLLVNPEAFRLTPGAQQAVRLIGRVDRVRERRQKVKLTFALDGGPDRQVEVRLKVKRRGLFG